jgi:hypothetical protein
LKTLIFRFFFIYVLFGIFLKTPFTQSLKKNYPFNFKSHCLGKLTHFGEIQ